MCTTCNQSISTCSCSKSKSDNVSYVGPNLTCSGIDTNDNLTLVIQKLNDTFCTTTTTTTVNCFIWEANISQFDTNVPTVTVVNSTFGEEYISIDYLGIGNYTLTFNGQIPQFGNGTILLHTSVTTFGLIQGIITSSNSILFITTDFDGTTEANNILNGSISIKHCNNLPPTPTTTTTTTI